MVLPEDFIIRRQCTPFCETQCHYAGQHHPILVAVINCVDEKGYNEFTKKISKYVKRGWKIDDPIEDPEPEFCYPLVHWATVLGNVIVLRWCVENELNLDKRWGQRSETALHRLMVCGYSALQENCDNMLKTFKKLVKLLKILLQSKDDNNDLPLHVAAKVLVERPLMSDSHFDDIYTEMLKTLVQKTCELDLTLLNHQNIEGNTVMHILAQHDKACEVLELLIESGADCDLKNSEGLKPIDIARSKDATDAIRALSKDEETLDGVAVEEIGDIDIIYIESDDDEDKNNYDKDDAYIRNLLERVKSEPDDGKDPDWEYNVSGLNASSSQDTLFSLDENSDIAFENSASLAEENRLQAELNNSLLGEIKSSSNSQKTGREHTSNLKRKVSKFCNSGAHVSKKLHSDNDSTTSLRESTSLNQNSPADETSAIQNSTDGCTTLKRKLSDKGIRPEVKKQKGASGQSKPTEVSAKLVIPKLNIPAFNSLKSKSGKFMKLLALNTDADKTSSAVRKTGSAGETVSSATKKTALTIEQSDSTTDGTFETKPKHSDSSEVEEKCTLTNQLQSKTILKESDSSILQPLPGLCATKVDSTITQGQTLNSAEAPDKEDCAPQISKSIKKRFDSSAEIRSAYARLQKKISGGSTNGIYAKKLHELFDILKPKPVENTADQAAVRCTPSPEYVNQSTPSPASVDKLQSEEQINNFAMQQLMTSRLISTPEPPERSPPSPGLLDQQRSKKRLEDVVTSLRERQQGRRSRKSSDGSVGAELDNVLSPPSKSPENPSSDSWEQSDIASTNAAIQHEVEREGRTQSDKADTTSGQRLSDTQLKEQEQGSTAVMSPTKTGLAQFDHEEGPSIEGEATTDDLVSHQTTDTAVPALEKDFASDAQPPPAGEERECIETADVTESSESASPCAFVQQRALPEEDLNKTAEESNDKLPLLQATDAIIKSENIDKDVDRASDTLSGNMTTTEQTAPEVNTTYGGVTVKVEVEEVEGGSTIKTPASEQCSTGSIVTKPTNKRPRMPRNALPTQVLDGLYKAMVPPGSVESASKSTSTSVNTSKNATSDTAKKYQSLSSLVSEVFDEVNTSASSRQGSSSGSTTDPNYNNKLSSIIDKICEEVYGISPGPKRQKLAEEASKQHENQQVVSARVQEPTQPSSTLTSHRQVIQLEPTPFPASVVEQETGRNTVEGEVRARTETQSQQGVQAHVQTLGQPSAQTQLRTTAADCSRSMQAQKTLGVTVPAGVGVQQFQRRLQVPSQLTRQLKPGNQVQSALQTTGLQQPNMVQQGHRFSSIQNVVNNGNRRLILQNVNVSSNPQNMTSLANRLHPLVVQVNNNGASSQTVVQNTQDSVNKSVHPYFPMAQSGNQLSTFVTPTAQAGVFNPTMTSRLHVPNPISHVPNSTVMPQTRVAYQTIAPRLHAPNPTIVSQAHLSSLAAMAQALVHNPNMVSQPLFTIPTTNSHPHVATPTVARTNPGHFVKQTQPSHACVSSPTVAHQPLAPKPAAPVEGERVLTYRASRLANASGRQLTLDEAKRYFAAGANSHANANHLSNILTNQQVQSVNAKPNATYGSGHITHTTAQVRSTVNANLTTRTAQCLPRAVGPDTATALANQIRPTERTLINTSATPLTVSLSIVLSPPAPMTTVQTSSSEIENRESIISGPTSSSSLGLSQRLAQPLGNASVVTSQSQLSARGEDTNHEESEDEGLGLNAFSESENMKDMFKDLTDTKKMLERLLSIVPKEDILRLLEKVKLDRQEQINKWTKEYEAALQSEWDMYNEFQQLRGKVERGQEAARKLCDKIMMWKNRAEACRKERSDAAKKKTLYQHKIAEEKEKIPMISECIAMFSNTNEDPRSDQ